MGHYICKICGEMFHGSQSKRYCKGHMKKHQKPVDGYKCSGCNKTFPESWRLNRHIKEVHNSLPKIKDTYKCSKCDKFFKFKSKLNEHFQSAHSSKKKVHTCTICKKGFSFHCRLNAHMQSFHVSKASKELDFGLDTANAAVVANDQ